MVQQTRSGAGDRCTVVDWQSLRESIRSTPVARSMAQRPAKGEYQPRSGEPPPGNGFGIAARIGPAIDRESTLGADTALAEQRGPRGVADWPANRTASSRGTSSWKT